MKSLSNLKKDMEFNKGLLALIGALKIIAVSQYRALEQRIRSYGKFPSAIESFFELIDIQKVKHPFLNQESQLQGIVAITSDSGLLGGLNMQVIHTALRELEEIPGRLIVIGERGKGYARDSHIPFTAFSGIKDEDRYFQAMQLRDYVVKLVLRGHVGGLKVVYPHPLSFTVQRVQTIPLLPYTRFSTEGSISKTMREIIIESSLEGIIEYLITLWIGQKLYEIFGFSRLAEFAARFVHLEESSQKLKEVDAKTRLEYFRVRHELIDRNMRDLFSARLLYANQPVG